MLSILHKTFGHSSPKKYPLLAPQNLSGHFTSPKNTPYLPEDCRLQEISPLAHYHTTCSPKIAHFADFSGEQMGRKEWLPVIYRVKSRRNPYLVPLKIFNIVMRNPQELHICLHNTARILWTLAVDLRGQRPVLVLLQSRVL